MRKENEVTTSFKIINKIKDIHQPGDYKYIERKITRGHDKSSSNPTSSQYTPKFLLPVPVKMWHALFQEAVNADNVDSFKRKIHDSTVFDKKHDTKKKILFSSYEDPVYTN